MRLDLLVKLPPFLQHTLFTVTVQMWTEVLYMVVARKLHPANHAPILEREPLRYLL